VQADGGRWTGPACRRKMMYGILEEGGEEEEEEEEEEEGGGGVVGEGLEAEPAHTRLCGDEAGSTSAGSPHRSDSTK